MLTFDNVSFHYDPLHPVLRNVSFTIGVGQCILLGGKNGAGKSTILKLANGLLRPLSGRVLHAESSTEGKRVSHMARHVSVTYQRPADQLTESTVWNEIRLSTALVSNRPDSRTMEEALHLTDLFDDRDRHPYDLDPARRRLLTIASAYSAGSPVVLLDEPTAGFGSVEMASFSRILKAFLATERAVVIVAHDPGSVWTMVSRVLVLANGGISLDAPKTEQLKVSDVMEAAELEVPPALRAMAILK